MDERMMHSPYVRTRRASEAVIKMEAAALVGRVLLRIKICGRPQELLRSCSHVRRTMAEASMCCEPMTSTVNQSTIS